MGPRQPSLPRQKRRPKKLFARRVFHLRQAHLHVVFSQPSPSRPRTFRLRLGSQVNTFVEQAGRVDTMDRELVVQRDRALRLQLASQKLRKGTDDLMSELELILHHQDEMHAALSQLERKVEEEGRSFPERPSERQQAYALVEDLDRKLSDTRTVLAESIQQLNSRTGGDANGYAGVGGGGAGAPAGPPALSRMVHVLDVHLNAFQFLEANSVKLDAALSQADSLLAQPHHPAAGMLY